MNAFLRRLSWLIRRRQKEVELREELEFHLTEEAEEREALGLAEEQARFTARRDLGSVALISEDAAAAWGWPVLEQFAQDLRYGVRMLFRNPGFTLVAVATLALGIGLTTAIFSVVYAMLLRPLPLNRPDRLVALVTVDDGGRDISNVLSPPNFMSLKEAIEAEGGRSFASMAGFSESELTLTGAGEARRVGSARVSAGFFEMLDAAPILGRTFRREENDPGKHLVVVLSHALWQQQFGGDRGVIDRTILLNGISHTVIGVMAPGFEFPSGRALWVPQTYGGYFSSSSTAGRRSNTIVDVVARLRSDVGLEAARAELRMRGSRLEARFPETNAGVSFTAIPLRENLVGDVRAMLLLLLGAVGLVLVIASANVAGLLLARTASRREEIAVRSALGAGRGRIVRQLVTESLVLGVGGNLFGLVLAFWVSSSIAAAHAEGLRRLGLADAVRLDGPVLVFALGITLLAIVLAGLVPAFRAADDLARELHSGGRSGLARQRGERFRSGLVVAQLALAVVLLVGAGLLIKSFLQLASVDPGIRTERILTFRIAVPSSVYTSSARISEFYDRLLERIDSHPGVESAAAIFRLPVRQSTFGSRFFVEGQMQKERAIGVQVISPGYFRTLDVPILRGRGITQQDRAGTLPVVLVNESAAKWLFPGEDPIGRRLVQFSYDPIENAAYTFTIVGIVDDVRTSGLGQKPEPEAFFAQAQVAQANMFLVVHTAGDPLGVARGIRTEIRALDSAIPITELRPMEEVVTDSLARQRLLTGMLSGFSAVALVLAAIGIFGLVSFAVTERTREIGVRIALGATASEVVVAVAHRALVLVLMGLGIGSAAALAVTHMLERELFEVSPTDPSAFAGMVVVLGATAVVASLIPAWRAVTVDPLDALRVN